MWYNPIMVGILRSPFHGLLSGNTMIITVKGRKSGKEISTPVNYVDMGEAMTTVSFRERTWWRNLRGGAPVMLRLKGQDVQAWSTTIEDEDGVAEQLKAYFEKVPQFAKYLHVRLDAQSKPVAEDVLNAAKDRVIIQTRLS